MAIARELNVSHILEGSVRKDGESVRITAQLIDAMQVRPIWSESYLLESVEMFERVVEMDPSFARGWEGLAAVHAVMESWDFVDRDYNALALRAAERALDLRQDGAFRRFLERIGIPAYWRAHGFPPQCRPLAGTDFECTD